MITFQREVLTDELIDELTPLLMDHKAEICLHAHFVFKPRWDAYLTLEKVGMLKVYTAREGVELVGYAAYMVTPNMRYSDILHAAQDVIYMKPKQRGGAGLKLIKYADDELAKLGVNLVTHHVKLANDFSPILDRLGYIQSEKIYEKVIN